MLPLLLRRSLSRRFVIASIVVLLALTASVTWLRFHAVDIDLDINTGTARRPLVVSNGKVTQMPSGDYLAANTLVDTTGCSSTNVIAWNGTQFACAAAAAGSADYGSGMGSGAITVTTATTSSTVNLSTLGTIDWLSVVSVGGAFQTRTTMLCHANSTACWEKLTGGSLLAIPGVDFVGQSGGSPFTGNGAVTFSSTNTDSVMGAALSSLSVSGWPTGVGNGIRFMLPSPGGNIQRVARIYLYQVGNTVVCTAHAMDATSPDATGTSDVAVGTALQTTYTVTYTTNTAGFVEVICQETVSHGSTPNVAWGAVSLGFT